MFGSDICSIKENGEEEDRLGDVSTQKITRRNRSKPF